MSSDLKSARSKRKTDSKLNVPNAATLASQMPAHFSEIEDPRVERTRAHLLTVLSSLAFSQS